MSSREIRLKIRVQNHLTDLGFSEGSDGRLIVPLHDKASYRRFHEMQRSDKLAANAGWMERKGHRLFKYFADGSDINPKKIDPRVELITGGTWQSDLFRLAALNWRVPVSEGYGRRMRFLVWDRSNDKLIGLIALGDAVFNQKARDEFVGWDHHRRSLALVGLMDAYVLGAVPPYNMLLGGKLVASLIRTREVVRAFEQKYRNSVGIISGQKKKARLVAVTTSSALGRSSVYNRVVLNGKKLLEPIGYTSGWGHFHFSGSIFDELRTYLSDIGDDYSSGFDFGSGPNWKIRVIKRALERLGMDTALAQHGFKREVFICQLASNSMQVLRGEHRRAQYIDLQTVKQVSIAAIARWVVPRATRDKSYMVWKAEEWLRELIANQPNLSNTA